ncbi:MAG TPA: cation:proton antiporter [Ignavibacteriaceae bacterium]
MKKRVIFYILTIILFGSLLLLTLKLGKELEVSKLIPHFSEESTQPGTGNNFLTTLNNFLHNFQHPLAILILQILTIILIARLFGWIMNKIGQPTVIGEIVAGIFLGPSLLGLFFPQFSNFLFPVDSLDNLQFLSQIGLILFMFIIGMELDVGILKKSAHDAIVVSHASIIFPYFLGVVLAYFLYQNFAPDTISFTAFALFIGIAMSITAFPVLARIIQERDLTKDHLGTLAITCAAVDDVTAWSLLAVVIAIVKAGDITSALITIILSILYVLFMLFVVKRLLNKIAQTHFTRETVNKPILAILFGILLLSSYMTEVIGIHALFGAFMAGVIIPANQSFRRVLAEKIEDFSLVFLLPLFFVFTGLRTQIGLLNNPDLWIVCLIIIAVAIAGKFLGSAVAAKFVGQSWRDSLVLGALMNTRGLMELVVLNIGYDLGVLTPEVFTMLVLMALITTFMTGPSITFIDFVTKRRQRSKLASLEINEDKILISFGPPLAGNRLLILANQLVEKHNDKANITALHLTPSSDISLQEAEVYEEEGFKPIRELAKKLGVKIETKYRATNEVSNEIVDIANEESYTLLLVGSSKALFSRDETGGKIKNFFDDCNCSVGVLIDKGFNQINNVLLLMYESSDKFLLQFGRKFLLNSASALTIMDTNNVLQKDKSINEQMNIDTSKKISVQTDLTLSDTSTDKFDLVLISLEAWDKIRETNNEWIKKSPSLLIINR